MFSNIRKVSNGCAAMVNPVLSALFDFFLLGSAGVIVAGMVEEYRASRDLAAGRAVGGARRRHLANSQPLARRQRARRHRLTVG